ncbi:TetR/AcrR family transcriptional regulator [Tsukamurella ocularis]|uniref:TetR/AcrR family transcriptional regulator n=1 Tax=Tsukamurella ocularis TaxID=1970234 RepID=UPI0039EE677D
MSTESELLSVEAAAREASAALRSRQILEAAARLMERSGSESVSMQALAAEAGVSVGLIYRYFGGKDEVLLAVIVAVLDAFADAVPAAVSTAGDDPVRRLAAAFDAYCRVIDKHRHAAVLTYRESNALSAEGRDRIKRLEVETTEPLRLILRDGVDAGLFSTPDPDLVAYNLLLLAHAWALKHWYFERTMDLGEYVRAQLSLTLRSVLAPAHLPDYADLVD